MSEREKNKKRPDRVGVMDLASLRLKRKGPQEKAGGEHDRSDAARLRIEAGLKELRAIVSKAEYERALSQGMSFSIDGFRKRWQVGSDTLRKTNFDLFEKLQYLLDHIHSEILKVRRSRTGRSQTGPNKLRKSSLELKVAELETLLDRRDQDFKVLLEELRLLRSTMPIK